MALFIRIDQKEQPKQRDYYPFIMIGLIILLLFLMALYPSNSINQPTMSEKDAISIAVKKITPAFDSENLTPQAELVGKNWHITFRRKPETLGGEPLVIIDSTTGEVITLESTQ